ncbi:cyclase family protein [Conexibacter stalactiti]|uniref:Cyclase family protein n=1 Tax=Conexibacter stalactiti TaxID=1940611 RepID=A0ABU4HK09_9ACTN|nr:cyclase family protein [Conexibacter stalactiti]MDW5593039.1 cyclase family protein [Conexibacter stalactiti]MEC5033680.1 cyclase family protein [Conexibacter stalactiti]
MGLANRTSPSAADYAQYPERFNNWGRWGEADELGTLNHITGDVRRNAAALVQEGRAVSMARPIQTQPGPANPWPAHHLVGMPHARGAGDYLAMFLHSFVDTHIDGLSHIAGPNGLAWNGKRLGENGMPIEHSGTVDFWRDGIVTRGVLYDVPRFRGTDFVASGEPVHGWELQDVADAQGVVPQSGDAVIIRSGHDPYWAATGRPPGFESVAGVHVSALEFLHDTEASVLVWDFQDAPSHDQGLPNPHGSEIPIALHVHAIALPHMGLPLVDNANLEDIAVACAELGRWAFQVVVAPLIIPGATGSPVNPLAIL